MDVFRCWGRMGTDIRIYYTANVSMEENKQMNKTTNDMTNFETGAVRDTGGKGRMDLLPMCALLRISKHMEDALTHYPERNWEKGLPMHSMLDSALRHLIKYMDGQTDEDHLCSATTNLLMAMWTEEKMPNLQDIPSRPKPPTKGVMLGEPMVQYRETSFG